MKKTTLVGLFIAVFLLEPMAVLATSTVTNEPVSVIQSITLSGSNDSVEWSVDGYSASGFKVVWSMNSGPTYPCRNGDQYHYYTDPNRRTDSLEAFSGKGKYYVRVCEYLGGVCGKYSNEITLMLGDVTSDEEDSQSQAVSGITLSGTENTIKWVVDGYAADGFKVVWSMNSGPTYPLRDGDRYNYYDDPNKRTDTLDAFSGFGTYYVRICEYTDGKCGVYSNQITLKLDKETVSCTMDYTPVCGVDGKTYSNKCVLDSQGVAKAYYGECKKDEEITKIEEHAEKITNSQFDDILAELKSLRDLVKEQQNQIRHLERLLAGVTAVTEKMQSSINQFITYGVDENTQKLGEGERAAVMYSYKEAFGKLPEDEADMVDAIKIANGRWPGTRSEVAEQTAAEKFREIYKRAPEDNVSDNAAVTIMAYGLRQKAENRNLNSEKEGIRIFKNIYGHVPQTTEEWNAMQAITYSGATR